MSKFKIILITILCLAAGLSIFLTYKAFRNKPTILDDIKYNTIDKNMFGIFIEKDSYSSESDKYETYNGTTWPSGYELNTTKSVCVDENGETIPNALSMSGSTVLLSVSKSANCYIYFDKEVSFAVSFDNNDSSFSWNNVEEAVSYNVYVNNNLVTNVNTTSIELYKYLTSGGTYSVKIGALDSSNNETLSEEYSSYTVSQVNPTSKIDQVDNSHSDSPPEYSSYVLPDFDYINVLNFNQITTYYQNEATNLVSNAQYPMHWACWWEHPVNFYINSVLSNFCALHSNFCDIYYSSSTIHLYPYSYIYDYHLSLIMNNQFELSINTTEHRLYYENFQDLGGTGSYSFFIQFCKEGYVPSEWVQFWPTWTCVDENTYVWLYDEKKKKFKKRKIKYITYDDNLLVWDFDNGCFAISKPLWIKQKETTYQYNLLKFSDGSTLKTINHHRIFNKEKGRFTYPMTKDTPIGTTTYNSKGEYVQLTSAEVVHKRINFCNIITNYHMNLFTNNILTSCRLNNLYEIKDMKFVKDDRKLKDFSEYKNIDKKWYDGLRLSEQDGNLNKDGSYRKDINDYIERIEKIQKKH